MSLSPEEHTFLTQLRLRSAPGHESPPTLKEQKRAILILRSNRILATEAAAASKSKKAKKSVPTAAEAANALADLENM